MKNTRERIFHQLMACLTEDDQTDLKIWFGNHNELPAMVVGLSHDFNTEIMSAIAYDLGKHTK